MKRVVLVTGAAGGIGAEVVRCLEERGERVIATDVGGAPVKLDVTRPADWKRVVDEVLDEHGRLDVLMNIAGIARAGHFVELPSSEIDRHFDVNMKGVAHGTHAVLPHMIAAGHGHIINVGSLAGLAPVPGIALYSATKSALRAFSISVGIELAKTGVAVSVVQPDLVDTPMITEQRKQPEAAYSFSGGRTLSADEVARVLTGQVLDERPIEVSLPASRGVLCKLLGALPGVARRVAPLMKRRGLARQMQVLIAEADNENCC